MIANQGACVRECPPGRRSNDVNKCVDCEGACPKRKSAIYDDSVCQSAVTVAVFMQCLAVVLC